MSIGSTGSSMTPAEWIDKINGVLGSRVKKSGSLRGPAKAAADKTNDVALPLLQQTYNAFGNGVVRGKPNPPAGSPPSRAVQKVNQTKSVRSVPTARGDKFSQFNSTAEKGYDVIGIRVEKSHPPIQHQKSSNLLREKKGDTHQPQMQERGTQTDRSESSRLKKQQQDRATNIRHRIGKSPEKDKSQQRYGRHTDKQSVTPQTSRLEQGGNVILDSRMREKQLQIIRGAFEALGFQGDEIPRHMKTIENSIMVPRINNADNVKQLETIRKGLENWIKKMTDKKSNLSKYIQTINTSVNKHGTINKAHALLKTKIQDKQTELKENCRSLFNLIQGITDVPEGNASAVKILLKLILTTVYLLFFGYVFDLIGSALSTSKDEVLKGLLKDDPSGKIKKLMLSITRFEEAIKTGKNNKKKIEEMQNKLELKLKSATSMLNQLQKDITHLKGPAKHQD